MTIYFETLDIVESVSTDEIREVFDHEYARWIWLTTHYNPEVVEEANRAIRTLTRIRDTLLDPTRREVYDETLYIGGLGDPDSYKSAASPAHP